MDYLCTIKKQCFLVLLAISSTNVIAHTIPDLYLWEEGSIGSSLYSKLTKPFNTTEHGYYSITVDLSKSKLRFDRIEKSNLQENPWHTEYIRKSQDEFWNDYNSRFTFGFINGQFFNSNSEVKTTLSFPLKANNVEYQTSRDPKSEDENGKPVHRLTYSIIEKNGTYVVASSYDKRFLSTGNNLFVGLHKSERLSIIENFIPNKYTHIGIIPKKMVVIYQKIYVKLRILYFKLV